MFPSCSYRSLSLSHLYCLQQQCCIVDCSLQPPHHSSLRLDLYSYTPLFCFSLLPVSYRTEDATEHETLRQNNKRSPKARCLAGTTHRLDLIRKHRPANPPGHSSTPNSDQRLVSFTGVPVWSFDTVSIDSDLESVCTEQVRQHLQRRPGERHQTVWREVVARRVRNKLFKCIKNVYEIKLQ